MTAVEQAYEDYLALLAEGLSHQNALERLDYLHVLTLARLRKYIAAKLPQDAEKSAQETTPRRFTRK